VLALLGLVCGLAGVILSAFSGNTGLLAAFAVLTAVAATNVAVVIIRIRQGPRFQPGRDVPPQ
jgi:threonine synthase